jgi:membrane protein
MSGVSSGRRGLVGFGIEVYKRSKRDVLTDVSAGLAFWTFLSLFPMAIAFISLLGSMDRFIGETNAEKVRVEVIKRIDEVLSIGQLQTLRTSIIDILTTPRSGLAIVGLLTALWSMSKGFAGLCRALARIHDRPMRRIGFQGRFFGLALGVGTLVVVLVVVMQLVLGPFFGLGRAESPVLDAWAVLRYPFLAVVGLAWLTVVLKLGPGLKGRLRLFLPGAAVTFALLTALMIGAAVIVRLGLLSDNAIYGALGGVILILTILNLLARAILIGAEVNDIRFDDPVLALEVKGRKELGPVEVVPVEGIVGRNGSNAGRPSGSLDGPERLPESGPGARAAAIGLLAAAALRRGHR